MPDPIGHDDTLEATARAAESTQDGGIEATELDPYATALPSRASGAPEATIDDPHATRLTQAPTDAWGAATQGYSGPGQSGASPRGGSGPSRYRPVRLHARGGLGEIFVAVDGELNREVALKEIQERHVDHSESQFRFVFEAEVTGGLEHPGIVPVYGLGRHADGRPYYAMRFIRGDSLKHAIKKFHAPKEPQAPAPRLDHSLEFRQLLARFVAVCQAIDYAHARGVLHRDIKPDNIMLGPHGETLVVDWGLAKALNRPDPVDTSAPRPLRPLSGTDSSATVDGSVMGTPAYMSPEQAGGEIETLGPGSDIFSLGSTLYALMVGHAPFRDKGLEEILDHVKRADYPAPRSLNRAVPPALEAICRKAMARSPVDRYPTAAALADDLERWLADEPVGAYPEPFAARAARWARRHRTAVVASFALLLTAATALGISTVLIGRERARTERNFRRARSAVEQMLTRVGEVDLADVPQMEPVRRDLLDRALGFYREFLDERRGDPSSRLETGRALGRLGDIREMLGQYVGAERDYREALALLPPSAVATDPEARRARARAQANLGILLKKSNRFAEAEAALREALDGRRKLADEHPENLDDASAASATLYQLGTLLAKVGTRTGEDLAAYTRAIADQKALAARPAAGPEARRDLARYLNNLGILQSGPDPAEAGATFLAARAIQDELQAGSAANAGFRWQRARTWNNLANLYALAPMPEEAAAAFNKARDGFASLAADFPKVPDYRRELAITLNNLAQFAEANPSAGSGDPAALLRQALDDQRRLAVEFPEVPDHRMKLAITELHLGGLLRPTAPGEADAALLEASTIQGKLVDDYPQVPEYQAALGRTLTERARSAALRGDQAGSLALLAPAIRALDQARAGNPRDLTYVRFLFDARDDRARVLLKLGRHAELAGEANSLAALVPDRPEGHAAAAGFLARCSELAASDAALAAAARGELRETYARGSVQALRKALDKRSPDPSLLDAPDFKPLKGRPDFEKLREDWAAKGRKAVG